MIPFFSFFFVSLRGFIYLVGYSLKCFGLKLLVSKDRMFELGVYHLLLSFIWKVKVYRVFSISFKFGLYL